MRPFVKYVASNVKGGISCILGERTIIVGPNGSGKSGVVNALELACGAFASDLSGRPEVELDALLLQLAPERKGELFSRAVLSDGRECKLTIGTKESKKKLHRYPEGLLDPERVFPLLMTRKHVLGKAETARQHFLAAALPGLTLKDVLDRIPPDLHKHFRDATLNVDMSESPANRLLVALAHAKKQAKGAKGTAEGGDKVASAVVEGLPPLPTEAIIQATLDEQKAAKKALDTLLGVEAQAAHMAKMRQDSEPLREQLRQAEENIRTLEGLVAQAQAALDATPAPKFLDEFMHRVIAMRGHMAELEKQNPGAPVECPACKSHVPYGAFTTAKQSADAFIAGEQAKAPAYQYALDALNGHKNNLTQWQNHAGSLRTQLQAVDNAIAAGNVQPPSPEEKQKAEARLAAATTEVTRIETLKAQWAQASKAKSVTSDSNAEALRWKALQDACNEAVVKLLDAGVLSFSAKVQTFLPPTDVFEIQLRDGDKAVFQFGLKHNGVLHTALSGAEWARVMGAMAGACTTNDDKLSLIVPEERAFDPQMLAQTLQSFTNLPGQVVVTSPVAPAFLPPGWTLVDTTTGAHRSAVWG